MLTTRGGTVPTLAMATAAGFAFDSCSTGPDKDPVIERVPIAVENRMDPFKTRQVPFAAWAHTSIKHE